MLFAKWDRFEKSRDAILPFFAAESFNLERVKRKRRKFITRYQKCTKIHYALFESKQKILTIFDEQKILHLKPRFYLVFNLFKIILFILKSQKSILELENTDLRRLKFSKSEPSRRCPSLMNGISNQSWVKRLYKRKYKAAFLGKWK